MSGERASGPSETVREYVSEAGEKLAATANSLASSTADYAGDARRTISETSARVAQQSQSMLQDTMTRVVQEQPLTFALLGVATGAAVAAVMPASEIENKALGQAGEVLSDSAEKAGQRLKDSTAKAGERLKTVAEDSLKEVAKDVAGAFSGATQSDSGHLRTTSAGPSQKVATSGLGTSHGSAPSASVASLGGDRSEENSGGLDPQNPSDASRPGRSGRSAGKRGS